MRMNACRVTCSCKGVRATLPSVTIKWQKAIDSNFLILSRFNTEIIDSQSLIKSMNTKNSKQFSSS